MGANYHSIIFENRGVKKHTWEDWKLVPSSRPLFAPPKQKLSIIDVPGANGSIDLSEILTGYPVYENREGSIEFIVINGYDEWYRKYTEISNFLHGLNIKAYLEDDRNFYYTGRFWVDEWRSNNDGTWSNIVISYSVFPYKLSVADSTKGWVWDTFNFRTGKIENEFVYNVNGSYSIPNFHEKFTSRMPVTPMFETSRPLRVYFTNSELGIDFETNLTIGKNTIREIIFSNVRPGNKMSLSFEGIGDVKVHFLRGDL